MPRLQGEEGQRENPDKPLSEEDVVSVPQTDTGRKVEKTQAHGRTLVKELGNIAA